MGLFPSFNNSYSWASCALVCALASGCSLQAKIFHSQNAAVAAPVSISNMSLSAASTFGGGRHPHHYRWWFRFLDRGEVRRNDSVPREQGDFGDHPSVHPAAACCGGFGDDGDELERRLGQA